MILDTDVTLVLGSAAIVQEFESDRPGLCAELAVLEHFCPLRSPEVILENVRIILSVNHCALVNHDSCLVPLTEWLLGLRLRRNHIIEGS